MKINNNQNTKIQYIIETLLSTFKSANSPIYDDIKNKVIEIDTDAEPVSDFKGCIRVMVRFNDYGVYRCCMDEMGNFTDIEGVVECLTVGEIEAIFGYIKSNVKPTIIEKLLSILSI